MPKLSSDQMSEMIKMASEKLGTDPEALKSKLEQEKINDAIINLDSDNAAKIKKYLSDPQLAQDLINSPKAQEFLKKLSGK